MAGRGMTVCFHGAFKDRAQAERKAEKRPGSFVKRVRVRRQTRFVVMTDRRESGRCG